MSNQLVQLKKVYATHKRTIAGLKMAETDHQEDIDMEDSEDAFVGKSN